ncbi:hypothetical protein TeGR_g7406 [Tetraparma gracilis]|uniref:Kinetochore protein Spc24 n=1 Tax=Tetraparma gracilis TaxID=2962635 RepID=A0ABQ6MUR8_9STRA|nr:hypothetical protein TeGR_g7406 [Tetraparma gracilis]
MKELTDLYSNSDTDDASDAATISTSIAEVRKASESLRTSLSSQVSAARAALAEAEDRCERENQGEFSERMAGLKGREESLAAEFAIIEETRVALERRVEEAASAAASEAEAMERIEGEKAGELPRIKHAISLYANITGIKFDYSAEDGMLAGTIAVPGREEIHTFKVDGSLPPKQIADQLWALME